MRSKLKHEVHVCVRYTQPEGTFFFFLFKSICLKGRTTDPRELTSAGSLPKCPQQLEPGQARPGAPLTSPMLDSSSTTFPGTLTGPGSAVRTGPAGTTGSSLAHGVSASRRNFPPHFQHCRGGDTVLLVPELDFAAFQISQVPTAL